MTTRVSMAPLAALGCLLLLAAPARAQEPPIPITGRLLEVTLGGGDEVRGELIEAPEGEVVVLGESGLLTVELDEVTRLRLRRHAWSSGRLVGWVGIGAFVTAVGLTAACSQVEDSCGGVFAATLAAWTVLGVPFAVSIARSAWEDVPPAPEALRPYARFPQGAPAGFGERGPAAPGRR